MSGWDDLRFVLAVARAGSLSGAARALRVNHSTVFRRLAAVEAAAGLRLFDRSTDGYVPTPAGAEAVATAEAMEDGMLALERRLAGRDLRLDGTVRLSTTDDLALGLLAPHVAGFRDAHPGICVEVAVANVIVSLSRREADIALRAVARPDGAMVGRRLSGIAFALYAAPTLVDAHGPLRRADDLAGRPVIAPDEGLAHLAGSRWLTAHGGGAVIVHRANSFLLRAAAARHGVGYALLPCFLGDGDPGLVRVLGPLADVDSGLWLLTHPDLRRTPRIRALLDFLGERLVAERPRLEGRAPTRQTGPDTSKGKWQR